ncbi:MAG: hypothetical protein OXH15_16560 [Gammaproteobacteria bacterium]|nr:hypothetical protein [Gammaproteobacteria bacterium]
MRRCFLLVLAGLLAGCASVPEEGSVASAPAPLEPAPAKRLAAAPDATAARFAADPAPAPASSYVAEADGSGGPLEVMTVIEDRIQTLEDRRRIYRDLAKGKRLYALDQIDEAFPYLLDTAQRGFKDSQARVGHIYLQGLGDIEEDATQGVGWLGVASTGQTSPGIRNYFNDIWKRIPETHVAYFEEVVEDYRSRYGEEATGVVCDLNRPLRSFVKELHCFFEAPLPEEIRVLLKDFQGSEEAREFIEERLAAARQAIEDAERCANPSQGGALGC